MGVGITNAGSGGGGGGSLFSATLQIATDANAVITAVNLAGDTFSGTADSSGSLTLTITEPGTYTVTETDGGVESVVIADNGATYTVEVTAFDGVFINNGTVVITNGLTTFGDSSGDYGYSSEAPTVSSTSLGSNNVIFIYKAGNSSAGYCTSRDYVDKTSFSSLEIMARATTGNVAVVAIDEDTETVTNVGSITASAVSTLNSYSFSITSLSGKYRFGFREYGVTTRLFVGSMKLH